MYRVVAYHGKSRNGEVEQDLKLLWDGLRKFAMQRHIQHIYCLQTVSERHEANLVLLVQYGDDVAAKLALHGKPKLASQIRDHVDYWFYHRQW